MQMSSHNPLLRRLGTICHGCYVVKLVKATFVRDSSP